MREHIVSWGGTDRQTNRQRTRNSRPYYLLGSLKAEPKGIDHCFAWDGKGRSWMELKGERGEVLDSWTEFGIKYLIFKQKNLKRIMVRDGMCGVSVDA